MFFGASPNRFVSFVMLQVLAREHSFEAFLSVELISSQKDLGNQQFLKVIRVQALGPVESADEVYFSHESSSGPVIANSDYRCGSAR